MDAELLVKNAVSTVKAAKTFGLPTVHSTVNVKTGRVGPTIPELADLLKDDKPLDRTTVNSWEDVEFVQAVRATGAVTSSSLLLKEWRVDWIARLREARSAGDVTQSSMVTAAGTTRTPTRGVACRHQTGDGRRTKGPHHWSASASAGRSSRQHFPDHDTLMLVDIVNAGWVPIYDLNLSEDVPGYIQAPATALSYPWKHLIGGHVGRLATRDDVGLHQAYVADIAASARAALGTVDPTPYFVRYGENVWAAVKGYLDAVAEAAAAPVIAKYTGVLAAADVFTASTTFWVLESIRLDLGYGSQVHP
jgi:hypothetical protein